MVKKNILPFLPDFPCYIQQHLRAKNIRLDKGGGIMNRTVHMAFRSKMHDRIDAVALKYFFNSLSITNITAHKDIATILAKLLYNIIQIGKIACIRE
jgi:hypothetical protein